MNIKYRKCIAWFMLSLYLMLSPIPLWNNTDMVLCLEDACADCHDGIASLQDHCKPADVCRKSCGDEPQISDSDPDECFCCVEIPISSYIEENIPSPRPHNSSGGLKNVLAPSSLPDNHHLLNKASFPSSPNPHLVSTQKALRSVILII